MKTWNYIMISIGLIIVMELAGFVTDPVVLGLIGYTRVGETLTFNPSISTFFNTIFSNIASLGIGILAGLVGAGIAIGTFAKGRLENFIILPLITTTLVLFVGTFTSIIKAGLSGGSIPNWIGVLSIFILGGHILGFGLSLVEFFRGTD